MNHPGHGNPGGVLAHSIREDSPDCSEDALFACKTLKDFTTLPVARRIHNVSTFLVESAFFG